MSQLLVRKPETERDEAAQRRDPLFLFACHLDWRQKRNVKAYQELVAALDDQNEEIRTLAEDLLRRASLRPKRDRHPKRPESNSNDYRENNCKE